MTVNTTTNVDTATGDALTTVFSSNAFRLMNAADLDVYVDGVLQVGGYSVELEDDGVGFTVTFVAPPDDGVPILFVRIVDLTQETQLPIEGTIPEKSIENAFDKLTLALQQQQEEIARAATLPVTTPPGVSAALPAPVAGGILVWNQAENALETITATEIVAEAAGGADVVAGPASSTDLALALFDGITGKVLQDGPAPTESGRFLMDNGPGVAPSFENIPGGIGTGDVVGPASATDHTLALYNGSSGTLLKNGPALTGNAGKFLMCNGASADPTFEDIVAGSGAQDVTQFKLWAAQSRHGSSSGYSLIGGSTSNPPIVPSGTQSHVFDSSGSYMKSNFSSAHPFTANGSTIKEIFSTTSGFISTHVVKTNVSQDVDATTSTFIGMASAPPSNSSGSIYNGNDAVFFRYDPRTVVGETAFWHCVSSNGDGVPTVTTTTVPVTASTRYIFRIDATDAASIKFYIDGVLVATHTTKLPSSVSVLYPTVTTQRTTGNSNILISKIMVEYK